MFDKKAASKRHYQKKVAYLNSLKTAPCMDCRECYPTCCMDFDHREGTRKFANVSKIARTYGYQSALLLAEIQKCDLVCANCHRIRTQRRKQ